MSGPAPKPSALKIVEGNRGKRPLNKQEPDPEYVTDLAAPAWLDPAAAQVWNDVAPKLAKARLLTVVDVELLAMGCNAVAQYRRAAGQTGVHLVRGKDGEDEDGAPKGNEYVNPWLVVQSMSFKQAMAVFREFGMSPAARTRIAVQPQGSLFNDPAAGYFT